MSTLILLTVSYIFRTAKGIKIINILWTMQLRMGTLSAGQECHLTWAAGMPAALHYPSAAVPHYAIQRQEPVPDSERSEGEVFQWGIRLICNTHENSPVAAWYLLPVTSQLDVNFDIKLVIKFWQCAYLHLQGQWITSRWTKQWLGPIKELVTEICAKCK